jgi:hypothetical protein
MSYRREMAPGQNPHVNYEPSLHGGLQESARVEPNNPPEVRGRLTRSVLERRSDYVQARARYCTMMDWERDDLVLNMGTLLTDCERDVQERMIWHFLLVHDDYGARVGEMIGVTADQVRDLGPPAEAGPDGGGRPAAPEPRPQRRQPRPLVLGPVDGLRERPTGDRRGGSLRIPTRESLGLSDKAAE